MKKILVTGVAGFIGYSIAKKLAARGDIVIGCDNFNEYYPSQLKYDRATDLKADGVETKRLDLANLRELDKVIEAEGITHIVHMAAQPGVRYSVTNPHAYLRSNIDGFLEVLEC
ncbi:MAG: NAD-dependent epimerase/dehydratase family protein, partial [Simkaniaceae bacterium]|nr:NAD-dependent epimerase/dehydratase family protein [Simkaniaceae bacterium]